MNSSADEPMPPGPGLHSSTTTQLLAAAHATIMLHSHRTWLTQTLGSLHLQKHSSNTSLLSLQQREHLYVEYM